MTTGLEIDMYRNIEKIANALTTIATTVKEHLETSPRDAFYAALDQPAGALAGAPAVVTVPAWVLRHPNYVKLIKDAIRDGAKAIVIPDIEPDLAPGTQASQPEPCVHNHEEPVSIYSHEADPSHGGVNRLGSYWFCHGCGQVRERE